MRKKQKQDEPSLLWDCFTNWSLTLEKTVENKDSTAEQKAEAVEPEKPEEGNVEVTVKIKTPKKKEKKQD